MLIVQAALVGIFCWLGSVCTPFMGFTAGWYILSRPLVGGFICGLIFGDVGTGVILGAAVQAAYLAIVTPGGSFPAELGFISYPAMGLALAADMEPGMAIALAASIGVLGTFILNFTLASNAIFNGIGDRALAKGNEGGFIRAHLLWPQIAQFLVRAVPSFLAVYFGAQYVESFINSLPAWAITGLLALGGLLPAIGIATLLYQSVREKSFVLFFLIGFVAIVGLKLSIIQLTVLAAAIAFMYFKISVAGEKKVNKEEEAL
jgi:PTS system mannose-specific IIC component